MTPTETPETSQTATAITLPRYRCHSEVHALKVDRVELREPTDDSDDSEDSIPYLVPEDTSFGAFAIDWDYINRWKPEHGGYYVREAGGREIYMPAHTFEQNYSRITD